MGRPKALLPVGGRTMLERVLDRLERGLRRLPGGKQPPLVVVAAAGQDLPTLPAHVGVTRDEVAEQGPLQGIAAGLAALEDRTDVVFVSSCDAPLLVPAFVSYLCGRLEPGDDIVLPRAGGRTHPLAGVYRPRVLPRVRWLLAAGQRRPFFLFEAVATRVVEADDLRRVDPDLDSLANVNTPEEYRAVLGRLQLPATASGPSGARSGHAPVSVVFELFGIARRRAGRSEVPVSGATLGEAVGALEAICPELSGILIRDGHLTAQARLSVNGERFVASATHRLRDGDRLILLSAAAGG
ncbi:MAG: NTP transferase domain-containing protein [Acidobacteriota bacterium]